MASILSEIIGVQNFEVVANRIGSILLEEIHNQKTIQGFDDEIEIFNERIEPFSKEQDVMITIAFREAEYAGQNTRDIQGEYIYFIDIFTSGWGEEEVSPSIVSKNKLFRYVGLVRYILSTGKYLTLGFPPGFIGGKYIEKITLDTDYSNFGNHSNYDGSYIRFARIMYKVRVQENQELWQGIELQGNTTNVTLDDTEQGTKFIFNN
jgi:hypothetical protein